MGTYFGPDLKGERIKRSALQRIAEGLPPYTQEQLSGSHIKMSEIEQIYYYLLRKADKSAVVKVPLLHQFIQGDFPSEDGGETRPQFPALFPPHLHPKMEYFNQSIANVTYIRKPAVFYIKQEDIQKFKRLTGLENLFVETNVERAPNGKFTSKKHVDKDFSDRTPEKKNDIKDTGCKVLAKRNVEKHSGGKSPVKRKLNMDSGDQIPAKKNDDKDWDCKISANEIADEDSDEVPIVTYFRGSQRKRRLAEILEAEKSSDFDDDDEDEKSYQLALRLSREEQKKSEVKYGPGIVILTTETSRHELDSIVNIAKNAYALTGSAAKGHVGSVIGQMDIGESEDSYLFRVALPGVKKENRTFQCEVESDGRVLIKGETVTGEKTVNRYSQEFVMKSQNLCPPGPFSISFNLPGPVDPQQFSGTFGTNAILEGIVMKAKPSRPIMPDTPTPTPMVPSVIPETVTPTSMVLSMIPDTPTKRPMAPSIVPDSVTPTPMVPSIVPDTPTKTPMVPSILLDTPKPTSMVPSILPETPTKTPIVPSILPDTPTQIPMVTSFVPNTPIPMPTVPMITPDAPPQIPKVSSIIPDTPTPITEVSSIMPDIPRPITEVSSIIPDTPTPLVSSKPPQDNFS